ncbi:hypothetical protein [Zooshikella ganghwensis]|uniref:Uncharacterized protein n=1 Tax=Zooshikella ganghwensis TaxID=202772 RepID=A0A4P9VRV9_9GAMM|nr:hypothetical protein [Zooshikella ganghwensis]RDH45154.1 hypothetical protein B9G39_17850 [Zooshikella ganghwensis]
MNKLIVYVIIYCCCFGSSFSYGNVESEIVVCRVSENLNGSNKIHIQGHCKNNYGLSGNLYKRFSFDCYEKISVKIDFDDLVELVGKECTLLVVNN